MYEAHWGLKEKPFHNTPDPRFLYRSAACEEAISRLLFVIQEGLGAALLTGVFGCGKTVIIQALVDTLGQSFKVGIVTNPALSGTELLREITYQLGRKEQLPHEKTELLHLLEEVALNNLRDGKRTVIVVDEAHLISEPSAFEELRLLLNLQSRDAFLCTLILAGQPELQAKVDANKPLAQRIGLRFHMDHLTAEETAGYVVHRLQVAGRTAPLFIPEALAAIYETSGGIPRRINHVCGMSLLIGFQRQLKEVDAQVVREGSRELVG